MSSTSIDDLLSFEEERPRDGARSRGGRLGELLRTLAAVAAVVVVLVAGLRAVGLRVSLLILVAGVVALFVVRRVVAPLSPPPAPPVGSRAPLGAGEDAWNRSGRDALRVAINGWETPLDWSSSRPERFTQVILPRIGELADERLRLRHGVTRGSDPARARVLLGDRLWTFLEAPPRRPPSPRELAAIVAELEKL